MGEFQAENEAQKDQKEMKSENVSELLEIKALRALTLQANRVLMSIPSKGKRLKGRNRK